MRRVIGIILLVCILAFSLVGCSKNDKVTSSELDGRFLILDDTNNGTGYCQIIVDKETKVMYLFRGSMNRGGLTVMLDADGNPLLYDIN